MEHHLPDCDVNDRNPEGITKPCNCMAYREGNVPDSPRDAADFCHAAINDETVRIMLMRGQPYTAIIARLVQEKRELHNKKPRQDES